MRESTIAETFRYFDKLDIVIVGIGAIVQRLTQCLSIAATSLVPN